LLAVLVGSVACFMTVIVSALRKPDGSVVWLSRELDPLSL